MLIGLREKACWGLQGITLLQEEIKLISPNLVRSSRVGHYHLHF